MKAMNQLQMELEKHNMKCCPIYSTMKVIGSKFTVLILRNMIHLKQTRFTDLQNSIEDINANTLSLRLREMEKDGLIKRKVYADTPVRIEYRPTERGLALKNLIDNMAEFSMRYYPEKVFKDRKPRPMSEFYGRDTT